MAQIAPLPSEDQRQQEPTVVHLDPKWYAHPVRPPLWAPITSHCSLHFALKEFFEPLRTNDSRTDFFAIYRKESDEFDRDYTRKYDEDLNTSLIFVSPSPSLVVSSILSPFLWRVGWSIFSR